MRGMEWIGRGGTRACVLLVVLALVAIGVAACGGGGETAPATEDATTEAPPTEATTEAPATEAPAESDTAPAETTPPPGEDQGISDYVAYTGGTAGPADESLEPVKIGWVNNQGGSIAPLGESATDAAHFAVRYVNEKLGGIGGRPLELVECLVKNAEEEGLACGQQFLNDPDISVVNYGAVSVGANTINSTIAGKKPIVMAYSVNPSDVTNPNTYTLFGAGNFTVYGYGTFIGEVMGADTAAILYPSVPGFTEIAAAVKEAADAAGVESTLVGFDTGSSDLTGALTAAGAQDADAVVLIMAGTDCVAMERGIKQLGIDVEKVVAFLQCTDPSLREAYGGDFPQWKYGIAQGGDALENPPAASGQAFIDALAEYGLEDKVTDPWYPPTFSQILTVAQFLNAVGADAITPEAISEQLQSFEGPLLLGPPIIECGKYPSAPAVCADGDYFFQYEGDGLFTRISDWIQTPVELQEKLGAQPSS